MPSLPPYHWSTHLWHPRSDRQHLGGFIRVWQILHMNAVSIVAAIPTGSLTSLQWRGGVSVTWGANTLTAAPPPPPPHMLPAVLSALLQLVGLTNGRSSFAVKMWLVQLLNSYVRYKLRVAVPNYVAFSTNENQPE